MPSTATSPAATTTPRPRAIGIPRVSQLGGRERETLPSPQDQADQMRALAAQQDWELTITEPEINVSGDALLEDRPQLGPAVLAVQTGSAEILVFADSSRFTWNQEVRAQVLRLVESAGGEVWTASPVAKVSNGTPTDELTGTVVTASNRHERRVNAGKARVAVVRRVAEGVVPWKVQTPGLGVDERGRLVATNTLTLKVVEQALELRAGDATIRDVRAFLQERGIERSYHGVQQLLRDRLLVGEIHFGALKNLTAHAPFVDPVIFERAQERRVARGARVASDALLARLGVLRCGTCGSALVTGTANHGGYRLYRCSPTSDCPRRVTIGAGLAEAKVVAETKKALADVEGRASAASSAVAARAAAERLQAQLDELIAALTASGLLAEPSAVEQLTAARVARDAALEEAERLAGASSGVVVSVADWDRLSVDERRGLIRATVRATVVPATGGRRGAERVLVELLGQ